jgi:hypothetical protein
MSAEAFIRFPNELTIESALPDSTLVSGDEQYSPALRIEGKCNTPNSALGTEAQLLHVGMVRTLGRVHLGPAQQGASLSKV